jgi:Flp pilus assembly protein TadG
LPTLWLHFRKLAARFRAQTRASVLPIVAMTGMVLAGMAGFAIDGGRLVLMHSALQAAVDAGGVSAVAKVSTNDVEGEVRKFANANFAQGAVGATITSIRATLSTDRKTLSVSATAQAPATFMKAFGFPTIATSASSEVTRATGGLELALVLDMTGSMNSGGKLAALKVAAKDLLEIVFGADTINQNLHVGIVPFSHAVNIGSTRTTWLTATLTGWRGCMEARFTGFDRTDDPPGLQRFVPMSITCAPEVTRLTTRKGDLTKAVDALTASGSTHIVEGAAWGWRMLSPRWRGLWGGTMGTTLPLDYGTQGMNKAAVIMTDGRNEWADGGSYGSARCTRSFIICFQYATDARLNLTASSLDALSTAADAELDRRLSEVCTSMKNAGITVYTVAFGNPGTDIENRLRACATQSAFFFSSPTGADLRVAFAKIGDSLSNLRVSR